MRVVLFFVIGCHAGMMGRRPVRRSFRCSVLSMWAMPAVFMDYDEDPKAATRREVLEETGLQIRIDQLLDVFHTNSDGGIANLVIVYQASITGGVMQADDDADAVAWFGKENVPQVAFLPSQTIVKRWLADEL